MVFQPQTNYCTSYSSKAQCNQSSNQEKSKINNFLKKFSSQLSLDTMLAKFDFVRYYDYHHLAHKPAILAGLLIAKVDAYNLGKPS